jgi:hypothetical protein
MGKTKQTEDSNKKTSNKEEIDTHQSQEAQHQKMNRMKWHSNTILWI